MKTCKGIIHLLFCFILIVIIGNLNAQITIQSSEYDISVGSKHYLYSAEDSLGGFDVNVGVASAAQQTWTFTLEQFPNGEHDDFTAIDPVTAPLRDYLPGSNNVWYTYYQNDTASVYQYFTRTSDALYMDAMYFFTSQESMIVASEPAEKIVVFPAQMGASWTNNYAQEFGDSNFGIKDSTSSVSTIDAWGTINIPAGSFECLRVREESTNYSTIYFFGLSFPGDTTTDINYMWIGKQYGMLASIGSFENETNLNFTKASDVSIRYSVETEISDYDNIGVKTFELFQNFPNPFNPATTISYTLNQSSEVKLTVYNALGQEVQTLLRQRQNPGKHEITWNASGQPSGVYFCELTAGIQSSISKMILMK